MQPKSSSNLKSESLKGLKIGVLLGGRSSERTISIRSGRAVLSALKRSGFFVRPLDPGDPEAFTERLRKIDLAFIALHGQGGEDGTIQRELEAAHIPYVGSDPRGSLQAFDKGIAKRLFTKQNIPTAPYVLVDQTNWRSRLKSFPTPFFVKPLREGSSIGVFPVEDFAKSAEILEQAFTQYGKLLVEKKIIGREVTVGVLGNKALPVVELVPKRLFYDFRAKYTKGMTDYLVPAPISDTLAGKLQRTALSVHRVLGLRDFSRVDILVDKEERPYVLEANSIPGFTEMSLLPKAARSAGISFESLCEQLAQMAYLRKDLNGKAEKKKNRH